MYLDKFGPNDWQKWKYDDLVDFLSQEFTVNVVGSYDARGLPPSVLPGSASMVKPFLSLSRWPIERFNRWYENNYKQAKEGNIAPLVASLGAAVLSKQTLDWITEELTSKKPNELTWSEYLQLGGRDTAHTVLAKLNGASYAGILSSAAFAAFQTGSGEAPRGINNVTYAAAEDAIVRIRQFLDDVKHQRADFVPDFLAMVTTLARDNIQTLKWLTPIEDNTGMREERLARRTGFLKEQTSPYSGSIGMSPFSETRMYQNRDIDRLAGALKFKILGGSPIAGPSSAFRNELGINPLTGKPGIGYYEFIKTVHGPEAEEKAKKRDIDETIKRNIIFSSALQRMGTLQK